jgi:hypothetical protein
MAARAWGAGLIWGVLGFVVGAVAGGAGVEQEPRTVTVTSIVTSIVPASTTTTEPETTTTVSATTTTRRPRPATTTTRRRVTTTTRAPTRNCDPSYPDFCMPPPPDLDCADINGRNLTVLPPDPHGFDREGDGLGCES